MASQSMSSCRAKLAKMASKKPVSAPVGASLVVLSSLFYASYGIWTKLMGNFFQGYTASALRSVLVLLILLPIAIFYRHLEPIKLRQNWRYIVGMTVASLFYMGTSLLCNSSCRSWHKFSCCICQYRSGLIFLRMAIRTRTVY